MRAVRMLFVAWVVLMLGDTKATAQLCLTVNEDGFLVFSARDAALAGIDLVSVGSHLVPLPAGANGSPTSANPAPFTFLLSNSSSQITWANVGSVTVIDGEFVTEARYTGSRRPADFEADLGSSTSGVGDFGSRLFLGNSGGLVGDIDGNGEVQFADFLILADHFLEDGHNYAGGDMNCDGSVGFADFLILAENFGTSTITAAVPEPSSLALLLVLLSPLWRGGLRHAKGVRSTGHVAHDQTRERDASRLRDFASALVFFPAVWRSQAGFRFDSSAPRRRLPSRTVGRGVETVCPSGFRGRRIHFRLPISIDHLEWRTSRHQNDE